MALSDEAASTAGTASPYQPCEPTSSVREARINRDTTGQPVGAMLFLTGAELRRLGADIDRDWVSFWVVDGSLRLE